LSQNLTFFENFCLNIRLIRVFSERLLSLERIYVSKARLDGLGDEEKINSQTDLRSFDARMKVPTLISNISPQIFFYFSFIDRASETLRARDLVVVVAESEV
jgi:hypothetical protein